MITRRDFIAATSAAALGGVLPRMAMAQAETGWRQPNVLFFVADDLGVQLGCYGDPQARTPHLDRFARENVRFTSAFVTQASCSPSRSSILAGTYPHQNGQIGLAHYGYAMAPGLPNVASLLKAAGYTTGIIGKLHVNPEGDFPFDDRGISHGRTRDVRAAAADAGRFFAANRERPFFLHMNIIDPHVTLRDQFAGLPEDPQKPEDVEVWPWIGIDHPDLRKRTAGYYNCVSRIDTCFGLVLEELKQNGLEDNTLIIFIGDHGAPFTRGKTSCYESGLGIPMLVRWPGKSGKGVVREELVSTIDMLPTVLDACRLPVPETLPGRSLRPLLQSAEAPWRRYLCAEFTAHPPEWFFPVRSVRDARYKLIHNLLAPGRERRRPDIDSCPACTLYRQGAATDPDVKRMFETHLHSPEFELYDLREDPYERRNLAEQKPTAEVKAQLRAALQEWRKQTNDPLLDPDELARLTDNHDRLMVGINRARKKVEAAGGDFNAREHRHFRQISFDYRRGLTPIHTREKTQ